MNNKDLDRSRRSFLRFMGTTGIAGSAVKSSSLLAGLMASRYAQASGGVKRVVFVYTPMGAPVGRWLPTAEGLNVCTEAYEGLQSLCHFREVHVVDGNFGHIRKALGSLRFTSDWTSDTIDHQIAKVLGVASPFPTLHFGVQSLVATTAESCSRKNQQPVIPMEDVVTAYDRLFGAADGTVPPHFGAAARKANVLDAHLQALDCSYAQLSSEELRTLDQYQASLQALKSQLAQPDVALACQRPTLKSQEFLASDASAEGPGSFARQANLQAEIISQALACGLTNVVTLQLSDEQGLSLSNDFEFSGGMHQASCGNNPAGYAQMVNHLSGCVAYLIKQLMEQDDPAVPGTKLIDNTVVLQVASLGDGPTHSPNNGPNLLATRMPVFQTGVATPQKSSDDSNLRVLQTLALGLGLEPYIGQESHHCIWPCAGSLSNVDTALLA